MKLNAAAILAGVLVTVAGGAHSMFESVEVPEMAAAELRARLESPDTVILDMRSSIYLAISDRKIPGAHQVDARRLDQWVDTLPKDKDLVLYCA